MRFCTGILALAVLTGFVVTAHGETEDPSTNATRQAARRLQQLRRWRKDLPILNRVAVLPFLNATQKEGAAEGLALHVAGLFAGRGFEPVPAEVVSNALGAAGATMPTNDAELARVAAKVGAEFLVGGTVKQFRAHKTFGVPLPGSYVRTHATAELEGFVFLRSRGQVAWRETLQRHDTWTFMGAVKSRDKARNQSTEKLTTELFSRYLDLHHPARRPTR
jgi:hypothetical protein